VSCVGDCVLMKIMLVEILTSQNENRSFVFQGQRGGLTSEIVSAIGD
jgi:hypothetical protein